MTVDDLHKYKNELTSGLNRNLSEFEKNFFLVSAGTFTFSVTFIKDIVKVQGATNIFFLFLAWALIALSVALIMFAFLASAGKSGEIWSCVDNFIMKNSFFTSSTQLTDEQARDIKSQTLQLLMNSKVYLKTLRYLAAATFIIGIFSFAFFTSVNLVVEKNKATQETKTNAKVIIMRTDRDSFQIKEADTIFILTKK